MPHEAVLTSNTSTRSQADQYLSLESSDSAKPAVASLAGREAASPESAVGRLDGGSSPSLTPTSPSREVVPKSALESPKVRSRPGPARLIPLSLTIGAPPCLQTSSRLASASGPPSPTRTSVSALVLPAKKVSNLTFAVATVCARPEAMGAAPGPDRRLHEPDSDEDGSMTSDRDDAEQDEDEDEDENQDDADSAGYLEDSEGETTDSDGSDEEGDENDLEASPAERRRYRYKRHSMFGESDSDEDNPDSDALAEDGEGSWKPGQRDSVLSDLSLGAGPEPVEPTRKPSLSRSASMLRHRRSLSLKSRGPKKITFGPAPALPTSTAAAPLTNGGSPPSRAVSTTSRRTHFPTPLILRQDHSAFPRSPVPPSTVRGGGYSPRVRKGSRIAAGLGALSSGGERSARAALGRDDFLPTHLKSEEGKNREREYDSTTDHGAASGRCSRHRSPPPNSAGKDKMREHSRRSRSALLSGEDRAGSSRRGSTDPGLASSSSRTRQPEPPTPAPILLRSSTATGIGPGSGVSRTVRGELTPVFFSETEDAPSGCPSPAAPPSPNAHSYHPHFQLPSQPASPRALPLATPPPSRRVSSSVSERRASLSVVCSAFRRPSDESVGPVPHEHSTQPTLALDGTSPTASARGVSPGDGSLAQSLHQALAVSVAPRLLPPVLPPSTAIRPFSPPPSAPSSFGRHRPSLASPDLPPSRPSRHGPGRRRLSQPSDALAAGAVQSRPIACPRRERSGGWTDGC